MFEKLVITESEGRNRGRYFALTAFVAVFTLTGALIVSLFAADFSLGTGELAIAELIAPVEVTPPEPEPEPEPAPQPESQPNVKAAPDVPTRQANIARLDESPPTVPDKISTVKNTQKERPPSRYFEIGKLDSDPVGSEVGRTVVRGGAPGGSGSGLSGTGTGTVAKVTEEPESTPPKVVRTPPPAPKRQSLGVINGKAVSLPKPVYTAAAKAVKAAGRVSVRVLVDEDGKVVSADAVSGHPLLREAAESAARKARFSPTVLSGAPIEVSGTIIYNFIAS